MAKKTDSPKKKTSSPVGPYKAAPKGDKSTGVRKMTSPKAKGGSQFLPKGLSPGKTPMSKSLSAPKNQKATADSTNYYQNKAYESSLKYQTAPNKPEMRVQEAAQKKANENAARQKNKGKSGYDANGYPLKRK
jgi:hypothetical protein